MDDKALAALLNQAAPPAQDWRFALAVMARVERRRFYRTLAIHLGLGLAAAVVMLFAAPALNLVWRDLVPSLSNGFAVSALLLAAAVLALPWIAQRD